MQLPLFIYGTLLEGECNRHLLAGKLQQEFPASTLGKLLLIEGDSYPYPGLTQGDQQVYGSLIYPYRENYAQLLKDIDVLEDYDAQHDSGLYVRRTIEVHCGHRALPAQSYIWNGPHSLGRVLKEGNFQHWSRSQNQLLRCENL